MTFSYKIRSASELYWDGIKLYDNGKTGNKLEEEHPGKVRMLVKIPEYLLEPGEHVIVLKVSNHHFSDVQKGDDISIAIGLGFQLINTAALPMLTLQQRPRFYPNPEV